MKFRELHFRGHSTVHKIGEFCVFDHGRQPQFGQNAWLVASSETQGLLAGTMRYFWAKVYFKS